MEPIRTVQFVLRQKTDIDFVLELLRRDYSLHETGQMHFMRHFLDSFDWRLYRKNYLCGWDESINTSRSSSNREGVFFIHDKETDDNVCEFPLNHIPRFSREIAHPACRKLLDDILDVRALMTVAAVIIKARHLFVLNEDNKTLLMLQVENYTIQRQAGEEQLPGRLLVCPIKGYIKTFRQVIRTITKNLKLSRASKALIDDVFAVIGQKADSDRFVVIRKLTDSLNTWEAVQILLRHLLSVMQANEPGLRDAIDTEFLHDYRVAVRRARSMLGQIKHILPDKLLVYFKRELLWLGTITTPTRDLDIYLLKFDRYKQELPVELQRDLEPFRLFLERHWKIEHACLCKALGSNRYHRLIGKWQKILASENIRSEDTLLRDTPQTEMFNATKPVRQVASQRIWKLYKRVLKEGRALRRSHMIKTCMNCVKPVRNFAI